MAKKQTLASKNETIRKMVAPAPFPRLLDGARFSDVHSPDNIINAAENLRRELVRTYGVDYAFTICGKGHIIAASTMQHGVILAR